METETEKMGMDMEIEERRKPVSINKKMKRDAEVQGDKKNKSSVLLGAPTFEDVGDNKVRCIETGHEMLKEETACYSFSKKCKVALFEVALAKHRPPLNFFEQNSQYRDKIVCKLTGAIVNKDEDAVWKHVLGKRFQQKLGEEESKKGTKAETETREVNGTDDKLTTEPKKKKKKAKQQEHRGTEPELIGELRNVKLDSNGSVKKLKKLKKGAKTATDKEESNNGDAEEIEDTDCEPNAIRIKRLGKPKKSLGKKKKKRKVSAD